VGDDAIWDQWIMAESRALRPFTRWMIILCPVVVALYFGLWPELDSMRDRPIPGEIVFKTERPPVRGASTGGAGGHSAETELGLKKGSGWSMDWLFDRFDEVMSWEHNPWKAQPNSFGNHYFELLGSSDPKDQALVLEIRRLGELLHQRVLERYPELAVTFKDVPPEKNGFLKWLEFIERFDADPSRPGERYGKNLEFPETLKMHLRGEGPWDAAAMKAWLAKEQPLLDELRTIGLMPDQSMVGVDLERWNFMPARLAKSCSEALLMDARLAAEQGDVDRAIESVRAANGLADHFAQIETPTLLNATVEILIQLQVQKYALSEVIPAIPSGQFDAATWEKAVAPLPKPPSELGRIMVGEWNAMSRWYIMPMLSDAADPKYPSDPDALIDFHATGFVEMVNGYSGQSVDDWSSVVSPLPSDPSYLSRDSRQMIEMMFIGAEAWGKGFQRAVQQSGMTQAAFAIMKGEPVPNDPVHGLPYQWDPASRMLSAPNSPLFSEVDLKPITVP
jgi:hypothetical protein